MRYRALTLIVIGGMVLAACGQTTASRSLSGGAIGAAGGAAIASSSNSNETSPGCPPGYVVRGDAPSFYYDEGPYYYAAPAGYSPWSGTRTAVISASLTSTGAPFGRVNFADAPS